MQSTELGGRLSGLLERYQQYQDEVVSLHSWLSTQEQNQSIAKSSGDTDPQNLQNTLRQVQVKPDNSQRSVRETADECVSQPVQCDPTSLNQIKKRKTTGWNTRMEIIRLREPCLGFF